METQQKMLPESGKQVQMPSVIPFFNLRGREEILKRRPAKLSSKEALEITYIRHTRAIAKAGLKLYNETKGVNYELVDENAKTSNWFISFSVPGNYMHANFRARKADDGSGKSNPIELFFAETTLKKDLRGMDALTCCIIDEYDATKFTRGCLFCAAAIIHPLTDKYQYGNNVFHLSKPGGDSIPTTPPRNSCGQ